MSTARRRPLLPFDELACEGERDHALARDLPRGLARPRVEASESAREDERGRRRSNSTRGFARSRASNPSDSARADDRERNRESRFTRGCTHAPARERGELHGLTDLLLASRSGALVFG